MFNILDNDSDTEARHTRSGKLFREVPLANLFNQNYGGEGFYSGEEAYLTNEEYLESTRTEEVQTKEIHRGDPETPGISPTVEVSTITPHVVLATLSNQSNQSIVTRILEHT
jgi:hypothetical protein